MCGVDLYVIDNPGMHSQGLLSRHSFNTVEALSFAGCRDVWFTVNSNPDQARIAEDGPHAFLSSTPGQENLIEYQMGSSLGHGAESCASTGKGIDDCVYAVCQPNAWEQFLKRPGN